MRPVLITFPTRNDLTIKFLPAEVTRIEQCKDGEGKYSVVLLGLRAYYIPLMPDEIEARLNEFSKPDGKTVAQAKRLERRELAVDILKKVIESKQSFTFTSERVRYAYDHADEILKQEKI